MLHGGDKSRAVQFFSVIYGTFLCLQYHKQRVQEIKEFQNLCILSK